MSTWTLYQTGLHHADEPMARISADGITVTWVAPWKSPISVQYILTDPGEVEHRMTYLKRGRKRYTLAEFIAIRDGTGTPAAQPAGGAA